MLSFVRSLLLVLVLSVSFSFALENRWVFTDFLLIDERSAGIWDDFYVVDGRLVTGQNPASATSTAKAAVEVFEKL